MTHALSLAQERMMTTLRTGVTLQAPWGYKTAGRDAAAFWRTFEVLRKLGLAERVGRASVGALQQGPKTLAQHLEDMALARREAKHRQELNWKMESWLRAPKRSTS